MRAQGKGKDGNLLQGECGRNTRRTEGRKKLWCSAGPSKRTTSRNKGKPTGPIFVEKKVGRAWLYVYCRVTHMPPLGIPARSSRSRGRRAQRRKKGKRFNQDLMAKRGVCCQGAGTGKNPPRPKFQPEGSINRRYVGGRRQGRGERRKKRRKVIKSSAVALMDKVRGGEGKKWGERGGGAHGTLSSWGSDHKEYKKRREGRAALFCRFSLRGPKQNGEDERGFQHGASCREKSRKREEC